MAQEALQPKRYSSQPLAKADVAYIGDESGRNGFIAAVATGLLSGGAVYGLNEFSTTFRRALGVSGKMALVVTPTAGAFFLKSHMTIADARADPDAFVSGKATAPRVAPPQHQLSFGQRLSNFVYENPFKCIFSIAIPAYGAIFYKESTSPSTAGMQLSQRLIHTRVYGQMVAVLSTCAVMGFVKSMDDGGVYCIEDGRVVRSGQTQHRHNHQHYYADVGMPKPKPKQKGAPGAPGAPSAAAATDADAARERAERAEARRLAAERQAAEEEAASAGEGFGLLVPLLYAPLVPLMRIGLRHRVAPERLTQMTLGVIAVALAHAGTYMFTDSSVANRR